MKLRIQGNNLPNTLLEAVGALANKGLLRQQDAIYQEREGIVTFRFQRLPIAGKSVLSGTQHSDIPIISKITIRNVLSCGIEDTGQCEVITILFGISFKDNEIFLSSAEERSGVTCYNLKCSVSGIDIEIVDE
ncbi:MAG: hypothetical protein ABFD82_06415 [Syntrophaceae bacterium]